MTVDDWGMPGPAEDASQGDTSPGEAQLPVHDDEVMSAHEGRPTVAEQNIRNGAGLPAVDKGM